MGDPPINIRRHITLGCYLLVGIYLVVGLYLLSGLTGPGRFYRSGVPAGADFLQVWAASSLASQGQAAAVYDPAVLKQAEVAVAGGDFATVLPWHYPPTFLLLTWPASHLNYFVSLAAWLTLPLAALLLILYKIFPDRLTVWLALASIATAQNLFYGQGAALVAALLGGGLLLLDGWPVLGGVLLGLVINYKPHLGILLMVALLAGRHWRAWWGLAGATAVLALASAWAFGLSTWLAFFRDVPLMRAQLADAHLWDRMPTVFADIRLVGGSGGLALALQTVAALLVMAGVYRVWRGGAALPLRASLLVVGTLLVTPHAVNYDLTLLLLPLAWLARQGFQHGWGPGDKVMLLVAWLCPFLDLISVALAKIHLAPMILGGWLILLLIRAAREFPEERLS